ncbi:NAD(P)/FAD-dependent oxidoreductase [Mycobacterium sp. NPDC003449]
MANRRTHVVVIGGGYAGTLAANRLQKDPGVDITLVNARPQFVQRMRLHQFAAGTGVATADYGELLGRRVNLVVDSATRIDADARTVRLASGRALRYDYLIYAVGSTGTAPESVPGAGEFAYPIAELEHAARLRSAIDALPRDAWLTVVGGGLTGIETAAELAEQGHKVILVCGGRLAPSFSEPARRSVAKWLTGNGIGLVETGVVTEVRRDALALADGTTLPSAVTVWTAGFGVPELAAHSGLRTDELGRLVTDETLTSVDDERILAGGDAAAPSGQALRMCCYAAGPTAATAADTVLSRIAGTPPAPLRLAFAVTNVGLGRRSARFQFTRRDDTPVDVYVGGRIGGRIAGWIKEGVTRGALWGIRHEGRKPGSAIWPKGRARAGDPHPRRADAKLPVFE